MGKEGYVSIQAVNDMLEYCRNFDGNDAIYIFEKWFREQEPVQPKMGHWIDIMVGDMPAQRCDQCNTFYPLAYTGGGHKFCPDCGARMFEPQESEDKE